VKLDHNSTPIYGTYTAPTGRVFALQSAQDVYAAFQGLLRIMPGFRVPPKDVAIYRDRRHPQCVLRIVGDPR
jgi:hypothetical protein